MLGVLLAAPFLASADSTIANVAAPSIRDGLHASGSQTELVVASYTVAYAALLIAGARLGQIYGHRRLYLIGVTLFGVTSLLDGLAPNVTLLVVARVAQGAAAALMLPQVITVIRLHFNAEQRTRAIGWYAAALSVGAGMGQLFGGVLIAGNLVGAGWRPIFLINVPVCLTILAVGLRTLPRGEQTTRQSVDLPGVVSLSFALVAMSASLALGPEHQWPLWTWILLAASVPALVLFVLIERRAPAPLVDVNILRRPAIGLALVGLMTSSATYFPMLFILAQYLQSGLGHSALFSSVLLIPWIIAFGLAGQVRRYIPARFVPIVPVFGCLVLAAVYVALSIDALTSSHESLPLLAVLFVPGGFALGVVFTGLLAHLTSAVAAKHASDVSGVSATASQTGGALGVAAFGAIYLTRATADDPTRAFGLAVLAIGVITLFSALLIYLATRPREGKALDRAEIPD